MTYAKFFRIATGAKPYPYQGCFAKIDRLPHLLGVLDGGR